MVDNRQSQAGFALLVSLIVVTVVVSVGLALLDVTIKQLRLSSNSTDSEIAFHAANAGVECAQYWRRESSDVIQGDEFALPTPIDPGGSLSGVLNCFGTSAADYASKVISVSDITGGSVFLYEFEFSWAGDRCSEIDMLVVETSVFGDGVSVTGDEVRSQISGYPAGQDLDCQAGSFCTVISSKGYNKNCTDKSGFGTVQRDVLLEL